MAFGDNFGLGNRRFPPLASDEERSILSSLGQTGLTGLAYAGNLLDTPGSVVRGLAVGRPDRALAGIFDWDQRVRGGDITGNKDAPLFSWEGAGNLATEIGLDPLTYMSLGASALSKLGRAASKAGVAVKGGAARRAGLQAGSDELTKAAQYLASTPEKVSGVKGFFGRPVADVAQDITGKSLGGNIGFGIPFTGNQLTGVVPWDKIGSGLTKIPLAGPVLAGTGKVLEGVGRIGGAAFDKATKGRVSATGQKISRAQSAAEPEAVAAGRAAMQDVYGAGPGLSAADPQQQEALRRMVEGFDPMTGPLAPMAQALRQKNLGRLGAEAEYFKDAQPLRDFRGTEYASREASAEYAGSKFLKPVLRPEAEKARKEFMKLGIPTEGKESINEFLSKPVGGRNLQQLTDEVRNQYTKWTPVELSEMATLKAQPSLTTAQAERLRDLESAWNGAEKLAAFKLHLGDINYKFFDKPVLLDAANKFVRSYKRVSDASKLHEGLMMAGMTRAQAGADAVPMMQALEDMGLSLKLDPTQASVPMQRTVEVLSKKMGTNLTAAQAKTELGNLFVAKGDYDDLVRTVSTFTNPTWLKQTLDVVDSATNLFRGVIRSFPSYLSRNFVSAAAHNVIHKGFDPTAAVGMRYIKPMIDADAWRAGKLIKDANTIPEFSRMTAQQASDELSKRIIQWDIAGTSQFQHMQGITPEQRLRDLLPGAARPGLKEAVGKLKGRTVKDWLNPLNFKGVGDAKGGPISGLADDVSTLSDQMNRVALFIAKKRQGLSDDAARLEVLKAHYDFGNLSKFESGVMRRMMPFYNWARQNVPALIKDIVQNPGGRQATLLKVASRASGGGLMPKQLQDKIALPIGEEKDGTQRFLGSLGLPLEDIGGLTDPSRYLLGQLNPYIKGPLELATNRQFFSGRELTDLHSRTGLPVTPDNLLMNSPLSKPLTLLGPSGSLWDDRKDIGTRALNFLTGARLTDVDMNKERNRLARELLTEELRGSGARVAENLYIPKEQLAQLSPDELKRYRLYLQLRQQARQTPR